MSNAILDDEDDWTDLEKTARVFGDALPDVAISFSLMIGRAKKQPKATARLLFRRRAAELIFAAEPRFRVQIGGPKLNKIRIVKDAQNGLHECTNLKGTAGISLGHVNVWPNEARKGIECKWSGDPCSPTGLVLILPEDFAKAAPIVAPPSPSLVVGARPTVIDRRPTGPVSLGEPAPGRSALDQRRAGR